MSARVIVTQLSKTVPAPEGFKHHGYAIEELGLGILGGLQIVSDPGYEITAVYIVDDPSGVGSSPDTASNWIDTNS
jgi:hypothetical protein